MKKRRRKLIKVSKEATKEKKNKSNKTKEIKQEIIIMKYKKNVITKVKNNNYHSFLL